jgi:hypothetical protein
MEKVIVDLKNEKLVFIDINNLNDYDSEYTELPYLIQKGVKLTEEENKKMFKEMMEDYQKRFEDTKTLICSKSFTIKTSKKRLREKIKEMEQKRFSNSNI